VIVPKLLDHARGGAIDLDEIAPPEILDPRQVKGSAYVPGMFYGACRPRQRL
jgi:hypothetical protein